MAKKPAFLYKGKESAKEERAEKRAGKGKESPMMEKAEMKKMKGKRGKC